KPQTIFLREVAFPACADSIGVSAVGVILLNRRIKIAIGMSSAASQGQRGASRDIIESDIAGRGIKAATGQNRRTVKPGRRIAFADGLHHATELAAIFSRNA